MWPTEADAREYRGLVLAPCFNPHKESTIWGWWELRHKISNDPILFICADNDEMAEEYATRVAELANWQHMRQVPEWSAPPHRYELIDYLRSTSQVFYQPSFDALWTKEDGQTTPPEDWCDDVPFGTTAQVKS